MTEASTPGIDWDEHHVKALLSEPDALLREEPWGSWIKGQGGLKAVHTSLRTLPLSEKHRKTLNALLAEPDASMQKYALMLHVSVATYVRYRASLLKTLATVLNAQAADTPAPPPKTGPATKTNLPRQRMPLIGRETELQAVRQLLLHEGASLLTITGLGGIGKTRLTLEVAASLIDDFEHGVYFVSLAAITNPDLVAATIAQTLGLKTVESRPLNEVLKGYLVDKQMLLVLDNFEQVTAAAPLLHDLLTAAPDLKILVTSRAVLHVYGEFEYNVPPLVVPDLANLPPLEALARSPAVALFVSRAQAVNTHFKLTADNAPVVAEACVRLEGIPLALELAAARIKFFSPIGLLQELSNRLTLLSQQSSDRSPRHQTLRNALTWSYQLLEADEQTLFIQLGVFAGGCTLDAVEAVCEAGSKPGISTLERVASLVDKSMLLHELQADGRPRFKMLEIVRDYALEQLEAAGQTGAVCGRHLAYFLKLVEAIEPGPIEPNLPAWMKRLEEEHDNLRAALKWALESHNDEAALRLVGAVWRFWQIHGHVNEGHQWLKAVIAQSASIQTLPRAKALWGAGWLGMVTGRLDEARGYFEEGVSLARSLNEKRYLGLSLHGIGAIARSQGDFKRSQVAFEESLPLLQTSGSTEDVAWTFEHLGVTALEQGDFEPAISYLSQSLALFQTLQQRWACGEAITFIGHAALQQGDSALAQERYEAALAIYKELDDRPNIALINSYIGATLFGRGDDNAAIGLYKENLILSQDMKEYWGLVWGVERLAEAAEKLGQPQRAARLWGAANAQRHAAGVLWHPGFHSYYKEERFAALKQQLGEAQWQHLWAEGQALTVDQIVADALEIGE